MLSLEHILNMLPDVHIVHQRDIIKTESRGICECMCVCVCMHIFGIYVYIGG